MGSTIAHAGGNIETIVAAYWTPSGRVSIFCGRNSKEKTMAAYKKTEAAIAKLSPEEYRVTQQSGTERPGTGALLHNEEPGIYVDIVSGEPLFASSDKYESRSEEHTSELQSLMR